MKIRPLKLPGGVRVYGSGLFVGTAVSKEHKAKLVKNV